MKKILMFVLLMGLLAAGQVFAAAVQSEALIAGVRDNSGEPLALGLVYTYAAGTLNAKTTWSDSAKSATHANPIVLDAYGRSSVYLDGVYKFIIKDSSGTTLMTIDGLTYADPTAVTATTFTSLTATNGTIASFSSTQAFLNNATISSSTWNNGYINAATISNLSAPTAAGDAATKAYVDAINASLSALIASLTP